MAKAKNTETPSRENKAGARSAALPVETSELLAVAKTATEAFNVAVMASDDAGAAEAVELVQAVIWKLNGGTFFACMADEDSASNVVARYCAAVPGAVPAWGQQGEFLIEVAGMRALVAQFGDLHCALRTRNGADCTRWFPEVSAVLAGAGHGRMVVDGEMCILDSQGRSDFDALHDRARRRKLSPDDRLVTFCVFDLLVHDERSVMMLPLIERKEMLSKLLMPSLPNVLYARHITADEVENPVSWLYSHALELKLEGVVGKLATSSYQPGERSTDWFKLKRPGAVPPERFHRKK